jgi:hypothetical protein
MKGSPVYRRWLLVEGIQLRVTGAFAQHSYYLWARLRGRGSNFSSQARLRVPLWASLFFLLMMFVPRQTALGQCYAVTPSGAGNESGSSWSNAMAGLPGTMTRGAIYYLADGNYGNNFTWNTPDSGTETIEIRKAQSYDYGANGNCASSIGAGWNTATMGSSQAVWNWGGPGPIGGISMDYLIINGNGAENGDLVGCGGVYASPPATMTANPPVPSACGIKIDDSTCTATSNNGCDNGTGVIYGGGQNITWEYVEWKGQGLNSDGNNNSETYFWFANGGNLANDQIVHSYLHNLSTTAFTDVSGGWQNGVFAYNYDWGNFDGSVNHGEAIQLQGENGTTTPDAIHNNIFRDQQTNGDVVATITNTQVYTFYDNVDFCSAGGTSTTCRHNDGVWGCFGTATCEVTAYNNTFAFPSAAGWNFYAGTITMENNLFYGCSNVIMTGGTNTVNYNSYLNSNQSAVGAKDVSSSSALDPFISSTNLGLASDNSLWNNRLSLPSPYNVDMVGNTFTTDRGAYQFGQAVVQPPTSLQATPH